MLNSTLKFLVGFLLSFGGLYMMWNSETYFQIWVGLIMNTLGFTSIVSEQTSNSGWDVSWMYFLYSSVSSVIFYFSVVSSNEGWWFNMDMFSNLLFISMLIKLGVPPFHSWIPYLMKNMTLMSCGLLITMQKLGPLYVLWISSSTICESWIVFILLSSFWAMYQGMSTSEVRHILVFSSLSNMPWIMLGIFKGSYMVIFMIISYMILVLIFTGILSLMKIYSLADCSSMNYWMKKSLFIMVLSFSGFPPFYMFWPKVGLIYSITLYGGGIGFFLLFLLFLTFLGNFFFYLQLVYSNFEYYQSWSEFFSFKETSLVIWCMLLLMVVIVLWPVFIYMLLFYN